MTLQKEEVNEIHDVYDESNLTEKELELLKKEREINAKLDAELLSNPDAVPKAVWFIIPNEFCERFCFYGVKPLLLIYFKTMVGLDEIKAKEYVHIFIMVTYFFPLLGAAISDSYLGKYHTIVYLSCVYVVGLIMMSVFSINGLIATVTDTSFLPLWSAMLPLILIGLGTGGIKPCVSSHGGDQYLPSQTKGLDKFFSLFYVSINLGALVSGYITPIIKDNVYCFGTKCYFLGFGLPSLLFIIALGIFIFGHRYYRIVPPTGEFLPLKAIKATILALKKKSANKKQGGSPMKLLDYVIPEFGDIFINEVRLFIKTLSMLWTIPFFWMLYDQCGTEWQSQYEKMNKSVFGWFNVTPEMSGQINTIFIILMVPTLAKFVYPALERRGLKCTLLRRMGVGMFFVVLSFVVSTSLQYKVNDSFDGTIVKGEVVSCPNCVSGLWQLPQWFLLSLGESLTSPTGLNFTYSQVGKQFRSISSSFWLLTVSFGNILVAAVEEGFYGTSMKGPKKMWFFVGLGLLANIIFAVQAKYFYSYKEFDPNEKAAPLTSERKIENNESSV